MSTADDTDRQSNAKALTAIRIAPEVLARLNAYCKHHRLKPKRNGVIETAIVEFLDSEEQIERSRSASPAQARPAPKRS